MERKSIGTLIAALRRANGLTQKQLADQLGVSDKAVSRWERDESLPDLTLLPVIADLFHITVDELLRGERRAQADGAAEAQANADHERLKRQTRRVLNAAFGRAHGRMLIGLGCGFAGLLTAMICNFAVMRALPGLVVGLLLCLAGAALLGAFAAAALRADAEEKYDAGALREYRVRVIASVKCIGMALLAMIALILPLAACLPGISAGYVDVWVQPEEWLRGAALCGALLGTAACLGLYLLNRRLAAEGLYSAARRHAHAWVAGILTAAMCLTLLIDAVTVNSSWMDNPDAWANFTDFAAFHARKLKEITYDEMLDLATSGAGVLHNRSVEMAKKYGVPLVVRSSLNNSEGTVVKEVVSVERMLISGVALDTDAVRIAVLGLRDVPGVAFKVFDTLAKKNINVDVILQSIGRAGTKDISFTVNKDDLDDAVATLEESQERLGFKELHSERNIAKLSIVGSGMLSNPGVAAKMFESLYNEGVNINMISTSEIRITVLINEKDGIRAMNAVHDAFGLAD